ncbi:MAG: alpha-N-arabinofuranosidase [Ruminococcus sp.]|nr:alpha-N-arabinofuranosidase [Ruminococcus sp.]
MKTAYLKFDSNRTVSKINKEIYGHFSEHLGRCIYNGIYVGKDSSIPNVDGIRTDVVEALKEIEIPVLRWPGGCFADEYHWKNGIGKARTPMLNSNWGGLVESNDFGTHEFFELCNMLGCEPYLAGNMGSGTVQELSEWLEYITYGGDSPLALERKANGREQPWKLKYLGIGNETWGCGGNMKPEAYVDEYRKYQTFAKNYCNGDMVKIACGPNSDDYNWTEVLMQNLNEWHTGAITLHYYTVPTGDWSHKGAALSFSDEEYYQTISSTLYMDEIITKHSAIMDKYDPDCKIKLVVDEWGCWYDVEEGTNPGFLYQQNTMRDAIVAAINLNIFNSHSKRVSMANLAQVMNVLQATLISDGERLVKTPTWYVFKMFLPHHDAELIKTSLAAPELEQYGKAMPMLSHSLSKKDGKLYLTVSNCSLDEDCTLLLDAECGRITCAKSQIITAPIHDYNDFDGKVNVSISDYDGFEQADDKLMLNVPAHSVVSLCFENQ